MPVVYNGVKPDLLAQSESVMVEGRLLDSGVFQAGTILTKCPSKYEETVDAETDQR